MAVERTALDKYHSYVKRYQCDFPGLDWTLESTWETIFNSILSRSDVSVQTQRSHGNAVRQLALHHGIKRDGDWDKQVSQKLAELRLKFETQESKNQPDKRDRRIWSMPELIDLMDFLSEQISQPIPQYRAKGMVQSAMCRRYYLHQQRLLLGMYLFHPVLRHNYGHMQLMDWNDTICSPNYIRPFTADEMHWMVYIRYDKVINSHGAHTFELDPRILMFLDEIKQAFPENPPRKWLLTHLHDRTLPLCPDDSSRSMYSSARMLYSILQRDGTPSLLNVCQLRVALVSNFYLIPRSVEEEAEMARLMRTGIQPMRNSYHKLARPSCPGPAILYPSVLGKRTESEIE